jgi:small subunit ribosomal protein S1
MSGDAPARRSRSPTQAPRQVASFFADSIFSYRAGVRDLLQQPLACQDDSKDQRVAPARDAFMSAAIESFADMFEASLASQKIKPGSILTARVVEVGDDFIIVNAGLKSEAVISSDQFKNERGEIEVKVGDDVEVALDSVEDGTGETRLSREKAKRARTWSRLEQAFEKQEVVKGIINGRVKGGFTVEIDFVRAFLPGSLVDVRPVRDPSYLEGKVLEFKVIKLDQKRNNVVVSRRAVVEQEYSAERTELLEKLQEGAVVKGVVKNLTDYGAFVDLGGIDGLLHITDMAWKRVKHPSEVVNVGDEIDVRILKFDRERQRVSLGIKQLGNDPWQQIGRRYPTGTRLFGKVTNIADYGCFVEIEEGVEGLVHVSEMDWTNKNVNPSKVVHIGQETEVMVLDIDEERRRISLGIKQCQANPWKEFSDSINRGDHVSGQIKSITDFGIFIGLSGGIDGLVHLSDISWDVPGEEAVRNYQKGQTLEAMVLSIDPERERISLGVKQLAKDPFSTWIAEHPKNSIVNGKVREVDAKGAIIDLGGGVDGHLRASELARDRVEDARSVLKVGDDVEAKFINVDRKTRTIALSIKAKEIHEENEVVQSYRTNESSTGTSLGDLLKEHIAGQDNN